MHHQSLWKFLHDLEQQTAKVGEVDEIYRLIEQAPNQVAAALSLARKAYVELQHERLRHVLFVLTNRLGVKYPDIVRFIKDSN